MLIRAKFAFAALACIAFDAQAACGTQSGANAVPLVELYTSEGCSSCPPADRWLSKLALADAGKANFLAFHVDYWDDIGWHDRFGSAAHGRRQRQRVASAEGGDTVYTPQVMVGSNVRVAWSEPQRFLATLKSATRPAGASLSLRLQPARAGRWIASVDAGATAPAPESQLWLAQYLDGQTTEVRAGENKGVTLRHDHVVNELWGPWPLQGTDRQSRRVQVPSVSSPWGLIAFEQDRRGNTLQSLQLASAKCTAID